jgi:bifunctional UDP-N-acetylglucosamine pyrophosphorylase/glucosamine-1-phosphate N-acetyltransferase
VARAAGSLKTYVVLGHQRDRVVRALGPKALSYEQKGLKGTADAVRQGERFFRGYRGDILVLCGDTPLLTKETVRKLVRRHQASGADATVLTAAVGDSFGYGRIIRDGKERVVAIREEKDASPSEKAIREINSGVYCFRKDALFRSLGRVPLNRKKKEYYLTDVIGILAAGGARVESFRTADAEECRGINSREDLAAAEAVMRQAVLKRLMASGVTIEDPRTTYIHAGARIGRDTVIRPFTVIEENVRVGQECRIGPFARLRPGARVGDSVEIGNFAEVSRSALGRHCMMKHFSFLGDARVGAGANIGAGVVTANYDGKNKNRTVVGPGAFIGSDSILVAPVTIGAKAMTGAGCVVTRGKRVPAGSVVVGVPGRIIRKGKNKTL